MTSTDEQTSLSATDADSQQSSSVSLVDLLLDALHPDRPVAAAAASAAVRRTPSLHHRAAMRLAHVLQLICARYCDAPATLEDRFKVCGFFIVAPLASVFSLLWFVVMVAMGKYVVCGISLLASLLYGVIVALVAARLVLPVRGSICLVAMCQLVLSSFHVVQGSFDQSAAILLWICVTPSLTYILVQSKRATFLSVLSACFLSILAVVVAETTVDLSPALRASERLDGAVRIVFCVFNIANPTLVVISVSLFHLVSVRNEQERADNLLCKMLPRPVARMLQRGVPRHSIVERFDNVTCFFSDIVGFTSLAERHTPLEVIAMLNALYEHMDAIASELKVFKVAVIGDSYFAVAGAPSELPAHEAAARVARFALAVRRLVANEAAQFGIHMRIGLHSGPVVAGVIGDLAPQFTLIGDTVNVASRMEAHGAAGRIHCSSETKLLLSDSGQFHFVARPPIFVKGKGRMQTYWLDEITSPRRRRIKSRTLPDSDAGMFRTARDDSFLRDANGSVAHETESPMSKNSTLKSK
jgi:class 3 adenylate cyclase